MKRYEDEDQKSPLDSLAFPIGIYLICLCGIVVYVASAAPAKAPIGAFVSVAAGEPTPLAGTCAASEQQSPHVRYRDDFPPTTFRYRENRAEIISLADAGKFDELNTTRATKKFQQPLETKPFAFGKFRMTSSRCSMAR
ncbi:hypothetical protein QA644_24455 (plasmid) [Rhizobium sp. CC1099]|uniref:hypothetical protein n=1 Tax=Rhizobium sp. CC1099 TaxID=3039160 RepID=UPI0024B1AD1C|nr:hypothetical protein [Rhizobium sp. CC1099]WFU91330.1 hypothetical protein QA644_24455 [Rhizobium sp. CC1099]